MMAVFNPNLLEQIIADVTIICVGVRMNLIIPLSNCNEYYLLNRVPEKSYLKRKEMICCSNWSHKTTDNCTSQGIDHVQHILFQDWSSSIFNTDIDDAMRGLWLLCQYFNINV